MPKKKRKTKYDAMYRSGFEEKTAIQLNDLGIEYEYEPKDKKLSWVKPETKHTYQIDLVLRNGIYVELKGYLDATTKTKMLHIISQHPDKDIRLVFMSPNTKIRKGSKTTYAMWAEKNGIKWGTVNDIPTWAKE